VQELPSLHRAMGVLAASYEAQQTSTDFGIVNESTTLAVWGLVSSGCIFETLDDGLRGVSKRQWYL